MAIERGQRACLIRRCSGAAKPRDQRLEVRAVVWSGAETFVCHDGHFRQSARSTLAARGESSAPGFPRIDDFDATAWKALALRVAMRNFLEAAIAAMEPSGVGKPFPAARALTARAA